MAAHRVPREKLLEYLTDAFKKKIHVLDGGMGTMVQSYKLEEKDFRGNLELLTILEPR